MIHNPTPTALLQSIDERTRFFNDLAETNQWDHPAWKTPAGRGRIARFDSGSTKCKYADPGAKALLDQADDGDMAIPFVISTLSQDRDGDVLIPAGCANYLPAYARNPIWLFQHNPGLLPIGLSKDKGGACTVQVLEDRVIATCHFHAETEIARDTYRLVKAGILGACSVGFIPHKAKRMKRVENPDLERDDIDFDFPGFLFTEWELCEVSVVVIQSNRDAIRLSLEKGLDGRPLGPWARHVIEPYAPSRKHQVAGGWSGVDVSLSRKMFPDVASCVAHLNSLGYDASDCAETADAWLFRQPVGIAGASGVHPSLPANGSGKMLETTGNGASNQTPTGGGIDMATNPSTGKDEKGKADGGEKKKDAGRKVKQIPPTAFKALAELHGLSMKEMAEQANTTSTEAEKEEEEKGEDDETPDLPPGAMTLMAFGELCKTSMPLNENPDVLKFLGKTHKEAAKTALKAYEELGLDLGYEEEEDDEEDESEEDDESEEKDSDADDDEDDDEDDEELDEEESKAFEALQKRFTKLTGAHA